MMNTLREHASGWVAKILLGLLVLSFGAWGIGDIFTHAARDITLAKVGGTNISRGEFDQEYQRKVSELRSMLGSSFTPELLKGLNIESQVLSDMVDQMLIRKEATARGIVIGDSDIQDAIRKNASFKGESGKFDLRMFQQVLTNNNLNEKHYYNSLRTQMSAELLLSPLSHQKLYPETLTDSMVKSALERRTAEVLLIPADAHISLPAASDAELNTFYEETKNNYTAPEMREGKYIDIRFEDMMKTTQVSAEDISRAYRERIEDFRRPETREIGQLLYNDEESAKKAYDLLKGNTPLAAVAKKIVPANADKISLGFIKKSDVPANAANAVFELKAGEFSKPFSSDFGWHIFQVQSIKPEHVATLEEAQPGIEKDLKQHAVEEAVYAVVNKLEDALASGATLEAAAKDQGLTVQSIPAVTKAGLNASGKKPEGLPAYSNFVSTLFDTDEKNQSAMTIADNGSYFVIETTKVNAERIKPLSEVKAQVSEQLAKTRHEKQLQEKTGKLAADIAKGTSPADAIAASGLSVKKSGTGVILRTATAADAPGKLALPKQLVAELFNLQPGKSTGPVRTQDGGYAVAVLQTIQPATAEQVKDAPSERTTAESDLSKAYGNELYEQYINHLRDKYDVTMYPDRLPKSSGNEQ